MKGDVRQPRLLEERREGPLAEVRGVDRAARLRGEDEAMLLPRPANFIISSSLT